MEEEKHHHSLSKCFRPDHQEIATNCQFIHTLSWEHCPAQGRELCTNQVVTTPNWRQTNNNEDHQKSAKFCFRRVEELETPYLSH